MEILVLILYLPNRPDLDEYRKKRILSNLKVGKVPEIISLTGNHWRKIFSIYSKLSHGLKGGGFTTWQLHRDKALLTSLGGEKVCFSQELMAEKKNTIHIISGKNHWNTFGLNTKNFNEVDKQKRILNYKNIYLTPYFDYRQFPNELVETLIKHIKASTIK